MMMLSALLFLLAAATTNAAGAAELQQGMTTLVDKPAAKNFMLKDMDNKPWHLADLKGKVVLVNFWATWCPPCRAELPSLERLWLQLNKEDFVVLAINAGESAETIFPFTGLLEPAPTFPILLDLDSTVLNAWPVMGLPTTFIIDRQGRMVYRAVGGREFDDPVLVKQISELLQHKL
jgi:thiol-disulfide isomerase/thioredoxin